MIKVVPGAALPPSGWWPTIQERAGIMSADDHKSNYEKLLSRMSYFAVYDDSIIDAIGYAAGNGFSGIQIAVEQPRFSFDKISRKTLKDIRAERKAKNIRITLHAHDEIASLWEGNSYLRRGIMNYYRALMEFGREIEAQFITIHPGTRTDYGTDSEPRRFLPAVDLDLYQQTLRENLETIAESSRKIIPVCIENYRWEPQMAELLEPYLTAGLLYLCWDLAKTINKDMSIDCRQEEFFWKHVDRIRQVHLHDVAAGTHSHRVIGSGTVDFKYFLSRLSAHDVWDYCIEVRPREKALESLKNLRRILGCQ